MARKTIKTIEEWREILNRKEIPVKASKVSRRAISHWYEMGLIDDTDKEEGKRRYLNYVEFFWVAIMVECRKLGYSITNLQKVRANLFKGIPSDFYDRKKQIPMLEEAILHMIRNKQSLYLELTSDGVSSIINENAYHYDARAGFHTSFVMIRLNRVFKSKIKNIHFRTEFINYSYLTEGEQTIIKALGNEETQSITITKKNNEVELIELEQNIIIEKRIIDILKEQDYQTVEIKQHNGKISKIKRTVKHKPKKKVKDKKE